MRALHLVYLRGPGGKKLRYYPTEFEPLIIPWWFSGSDREIILAFYQQVLGDEPLPRVEVDWYRSLVPADRTFLQHLAEKRRLTEHLVVVKVRRNDVDLRDVLTHPDLQPFRYVAVTCDHSLPNETFGRISELTGFVSQTAEELYEEMAAEFSLRDDGPELLTPLVQTLLNPILVVEAYNALIDVQAERVDPDKQRDAVYRRILRKLLEDMSADDAVALSAFALRGRAGFDQVITTKHKALALAKLQARMLVRDDRLVRWAKWLKNRDMVDVLDARVQAIVHPPRAPKYAKRLLSWLDAGTRLPSADSVKARINTAYKYLEEGQVGRVRDEVEGLEAELASPSVTNEIRGEFWNLMGRLRIGELNLDDAKAAFRRSIGFLEQSTSSTLSSGIVIHNLAQACLAADPENWDEVEPLFRDALRRMEVDKNASPTNQAVTMEYLGLGLLSRGQWEEAESLLREALRIKESDQGVTMYILACGLRNNGRLEEAESLLQQALQQELMGSRSKMIRAAAMRELAHVMRATERVDDADSLSSQALLLMTKLGNEAPPLRAHRLRNYAHAMRIARRFDEANELESLAAQIESSG